mgnify:CR=1 FL=1
MINVQYSNNKVFIHNTHSNIVLAKLYKQTKQKQDEETIEA